MKTAFLAAALVAGAALVLSVSGREASARDYAYCAVAGGFNSYENCGYPTLRACLAAVSGVGGSCQPNPRYDPRDRYFDQRDSSFYPPR
jgi:hypothetical protein